MFAMVQEAFLLPELRARVRDLDTPTPLDDHFLVRWLRARNHDLNKAEQMLRNVREQQQLRSRITTRFIVQLI